MALIDIGNGLKQFAPDDPTKQFGDTLSLLRAKQQFESDKAQSARDAELQPYRIDKAKADAQKSQFDLQEQKVKLASMGLTAAVTGDLALANEVYQQIRPTSELSLHPDPKKRAAGVFIDTDHATGAQQELDPFKSLGITKKVDLQMDLIKDAALRVRSNNENDQKWMRDTAIELVKSGHAETIGEALQLTSDSVYATRDVVNGTMVADKNGKINAQGAITVADLNDNQMRNRLTSLAELNGARYASLNTPLSKTAPIPPESMKLLTGLRSTTKTLGSIASQFQELAQDPVTATGILSTPVYQLAGKFNLDPEKFRSLRTAIGQNTFIEIQKLSGAGYTDSQLQALKPLFPTENDTVSQVIAKTAAIQAINAGRAVSELEVLEASKHNTGAMRKLFQGNMADMRPDPAAAQVILNSLPSNIRNDSAAFNSFAEALPPGIRKALDDELSSLGNPRAGGTINKFKAAIGNKQ